MKNSQRVDIYKGELVVGLITRTQKGSVFEYNTDYIENNGTDIAFNLPVITRKFETVGVNLHTFFAGLLPEGLRLKALIDKVKTSEDDLLSLLMQVGDDCIGDISVVPEGIKPREIVASSDLNSFNKVIFKNLFEASVLGKNIDDKHSEATIPGVQDKISAGRISFPLKGKRNKKSYILKLNSPGKANLVENEHFFMRMAKDCGLDVAKTEIVKDMENSSGLLVERFDRVFDKKIHQEDSCQFLDRYPADKYRLTSSMIAEGLQKYCTAPVVEISKFIRLKTFSYLICNGDMHARNISIQILENDKTIVCPAYDLLTTIPYGDRKMALTIEGRDDNITRKDFINFGNRFGVKPLVVNSILDEICDNALPWIETVEKIGFDPKKTKDLKSVMKKRRDDLVKKQERQ